MKIEEQQKFEQLIKACHEIGELSSSYDFEVFMEALSQSLCAGALGNDINEKSLLQGIKQTYSFVKTSLQKS